MVGEEDAVEAAPLHPTRTKAPSVLEAQARR